MQNATLFYSAASDFTSTRVGLVLMGFTEFFSRLVSHTNRKCHVEIQRDTKCIVFISRRENERTEDEEWRAKFIRISPLVPPRKITTKERQENDAEKKYAPF